MALNRQQPNAQRLTQLIGASPASVVFVVGSGLSIPSGLPSWEGLLEELENCCASYLGRSDELDGIKRLTDPWLKAERINRILPGPRWQECVKSALMPSSKPKLAAYEEIWKCKPAGVISLNLDNLARQTFPGTEGQFSTALHPQRYSRFLLLNRPFLFQPHGHVSNWASWVLTETQRNRLLVSGAYAEFMQAVLTGRRLIVVGARPTDVAVQNLLLRDFRNSGSGKGLEHFWICAQPSEDEREWAEANNFRLIEYYPGSEEHAEVPEFLSYLRNSAPVEPSYALASTKGTRLKQSEIPTDDVLRLREPEEIRTTLSAVLRDIVITYGNHEEQLREISALYEKYPMSVHTAWLVNPSGSFNTLHGTEVEKKINQGQFGEVWKVRDLADGTVFAAKVLFKHHLASPVFLDSFRRGVNAHEILSKAGIDGVVKFVKAADVPAAIFMEYVEGDTLEGAINHLDLSRLLRVLLRVMDIVSSAHNSEQFVLHRDLKPSNIMVKNVHDDKADDEVIVLDFDLSWYEGALGITVTPDPSFGTYAAPEQLRRGGQSTRSTAVDVFGMGKVLHFVMVKGHPDPNAQNRRYFFEELEGSFRSKWKVTWYCVGKYLTETVHDATRDSQQERISLAAFQERLKEVIEILDGDKVAMNDLLLVELQERLSKQAGSLIDFSDDPLKDGKLTLRCRSGEVVLRFEADAESRSRMVVTASYSAGGEVSRGSVRKATQNKSEKISSSLRKYRLLEVEEPSVSKGAVSLIARSRDTGKVDMEYVRKLVSVLSETCSTLIGG